MNTPQNNPADIADYIADLSKEMALMARAARMDTLAYILEIASIEAKTQSQSNSDEVYKDHQPGSI